jgi:hypothetical protein
MKRQITCSRCGFKAFVDSTGLRELSDWLIFDYQTGSAICPVCIEGAVPDESEPTTKTASRALA